ncbi:MAG: nucleotidyltransferase family protein [Novosphingobium sp.]|nr:nucleotidyltransferase family protein [Novosphingobium sp.]
MNLAAIVLAAGSSTRFGSDKLSAVFRGEPLLHHAIRAARAAPVSKVLVVSRQDSPVGEWMGEPPVRSVTIDSTALSESLKVGVATAGDVDGVFIFLGDMPLVPIEISARLADILGDHYAALPRHDGRPGHPALLSARAFSDVARLEGDEGAGRLLKQRDDVIFDDWADDRIHLDIDRTNDLARLESRDGQS